MLKHCEFTYEHGGFGSCTPYLSLCVQTVNKRSEHGLLLHHVYFPVDERLKWTNEENDLTEHFFGWFTRGPSLLTLSETNTSLTCRKLVSARNYWYHFDVHSSQGIKYCFQDLLSAISSVHQMKSTVIIAEASYIMWTFALLTEGNINSIRIKDAICLQPSPCDLRTTP